MEILVPSLVPNRANNGNSRSVGVVEAAGLLVQGLRAACAVAALGTERLGCYALAVPARSVRGLRTASYGLMVGRCGWKE